MYKWIGTVALGLAVGSLLACSTRLATQDSGQQTRPRATIAVARDGGVSLNGKPATIAALRAELERLKEKQGVVWYARDDAQQDPTPVQMDVFKLIVTARLPIAMFKDRTFSTRLGAADFPK